MALFEFEVLYNGETVVYEGEGRDLEEGFRDALEVNQGMTSVVLIALTEGSRFNYLGTARPKKFVVSRTITSTVEVEACSMDDAIQASYNVFESEWTTQDEERDAKAQE